MKVLKFYPKNAAENPDAVLEQAIDQYSEVLIIGYNRYDGTLDVRSSTNWKTVDILFAVEMFKAKLMRGDYFEDSN